ncbi:conjugative transposon protein TraM [Chryseobacterium sp. T16E-39]|uniref:conjugative transposon protein TraM n=1 Tax=Chryseobacterium sp. T16E-39 TaxID=2015076 RepID=UPI000B5B1F2E|nr:conjugative transposon protein TraM [Chryseobacterium sp. T16E-39]ASK32369.1 conjugative transposon protein TraM [Chryseobacterium sp. T16E-39]
MNSENRNSIRITEGSSKNDVSEQQLNSSKKREKLKKTLIYFFMAMVCSGCLYLIFKPKKQDHPTDNVGFNSAIPEAAADKLQSDKQKAYEQQLLEQKNEGKRNELTSLSDYWAAANSTNAFNDQSSIAGNTTKMIESDQNALGSYRNAQQTLGNFYVKDNTEVDNLKREISRLKNEAVQNNSEPKNTTVEDQLQLMEKSYQMAAKYLPASKPQDKNETERNPEIEEVAKVNLIDVKPMKRTIVSRLYREPSDSSFLTSMDYNQFYGLEANQTPITEKKNYIRAVIHETQKLTDESSISLRLAEPMMLGKSVIPSGTILKATGKVQNGRLFLKISSISYNGNISPVEINIYDNDGQLGLYIYYSPEQNAIKDIAINMGQNSGTNIMMTQSAGQQIAADLTRGLVQGVSGYFQKKIKVSKFTVKAGHQVFLGQKK